MKVPQQKHLPRREVFPVTHGELALYHTDGPERLYIELTNRCNFSCRMCFRNNFTVPFGAMGDAVFENLLDTIATLPRLRSALVGGIGEPLLHPRFREVITALKARDITVDVQTNGTLLTDEMIAFLLEHDVDQIITSYECGAVGHVQATTLKEMLHRLAHARRDYQQGGTRPNHPRITVEWILTQDTIDRLVPEAREMVNVGVNQFILSNLLPMDESMADQTLMFTAMAGRADRVAYARSGDILEPFIDALRYRATVQRPEFHLNTERLCPFEHRSAAVVRYDGAVAPCYRLLHESRELYQGRWRNVRPHAFGSLEDSSLLDIWNTREYIWFRHQVRAKLYPSCPDCVLRDGCEYIADTNDDCEATTPSCADCLWDRRILICP